MSVTPRDFYGASVLVRHVDALAAQIPGVRQAEDAERIHKMRVASRRLRTALNLFGDVLPARKLKKWTKRVKKVTRALGAARDTDVQVEFLDQFITNLPAEMRSEVRPGLTRLLLRLRQKRNDLQAGVLRSMDRLESSGVVREMQQVLRQTQVEARTDKVEPHSEKLLAEARQLIARRREQLLIFEPYVHQAEQVEQHHDMRIAAKYLRYTLEAYAELFDCSLKEPLALVREAQGQLGAIHDADIWIDHLPRFMEEEKHRFHEFFGHGRGMARLTPGLEYLRNERIEARRKLHQLFIEFWDQSVAEDQWNKLTTIVIGPTIETVDTILTPLPADDDDGDDV